MVQPSSTRHAFRWGRMLTWTAVLVVGSYLLTRHTNHVLQLLPLLLLFACPLMHLFHHRHHGHEHSSRHAS